MPRLNQAMLKLLPLLLLLGLPFGTLLALPDDQSKPLELSANTADLNHQDKHGEYNGRVELDQGTTHLRAAKAITNTDKDNKLVSAFAYGDPSLAPGDPDRLAHYWTETAVDKPVMHAFAEIIRYYPKRHLIELIGQARVEQGNDSLAAPKIFYDTLKQHVIAEHDGKTRTMIIFHPKPGNPTGENLGQEPLIISPSPSLRAPSSLSRGEENLKDVHWKKQA